MLRLCLLLLAAWAACGPGAAQDVQGPPRLRIPRLGPYTGVKADLQRAALQLNMPSSVFTDQAAAAAVAAAGASSSRPDLRGQCTLAWRTGTLDHFGWGKRTRYGDKNTWRQRVFICARAWKAAGAPRSPTIFLYAANEANAELYLNNTGAMWENADEFQAVLVFPEHRFYGESVPFGGGPPPPRSGGGCESVAAALGEGGCPATVGAGSTASSSWDRNAAISTTLAAHPHRLRYLSAEQALADYAELVGELRAGLPGGEASPVIAFGGSYGGMLATWLRAKYPHAVDGAVAGSAPIWAFEGEDPPVDGGAFARIVAADAGAPGGAAPACADTIRAAWGALFSAVESEGAGAASSTTPRPPSPPAQAAAAALRLCPGVRLASRADAGAVADWAAGAFDYLAMGDYPYPSAYITNGDGVLPAFPMRAACARAVAAAAAAATASPPSHPGTAALAALADAVGVFYNFSGALPCYDPRSGGDSAATDADGWLWGYQACTEQVMPQWRDGVADLGPPSPWDGGAYAAACQGAYGVTPRPAWATTEWGGRRLGSLTNVVWTNGDLDPWSGTGVTEAAVAAGADLSPSAAVVLVPGGAHHLDLMFGHPGDTPGVLAARETTRGHMRAWVAEARGRGRREVGVQ